MKAIDFTKNLFGTDRHECTFIVNLFVKLANFAVEIEKHTFYKKYPDLKNDKSMEGLLKLFLPFGISIQDLIRLKIAIIIPHDE